MENQEKQEMQVTQVKQDYKDQSDPLVSQDNKVHSVTREHRVKKVH